MMTAFYFEIYLKYALFIIVAYIILSFFKFMYKNLIRKRHDLKLRYGENSWAIVTGATDGLGKAFCEELAKEGFNIILVSRTLEKLKKVSSEIQLLNKKIQVEYIAFDFDKRTTIEDYQQIFGNLTNKYDISILINNVGAYEEGLFANQSMEQILKLVNVNVLPQTILTKIFCNYLSKRKKRSAIIDLSSFVSLHPAPFCSSTYSSSKSYNYYLSRALSEEFDNINIDVMPVRLVFAETNMSKKKSNGWLVITPTQCVTGVLNDLGYEKETVGHISHKIQFFFINLVPRFVFYLIFRFAVKLGKVKID